MYSEKKMLIIPRLSATPHDIENPNIPSTNGYAVTYAAITVMLIVMLVGISGVCVTVRKRKALEK